MPNWDLFQTGGCLCAQRVLKSVCRFPVTSNAESPAMLLGVQLEKKLWGEAEQIEEAEYTGFDVGSSNRKQKSLPRL
jgi:hypothetical protein